MHFSTILTAATLAKLSVAGYVLEDDYSTDFYSNFDFFTGTDPTEGFVSYVGEDMARQMSLINTNGSAAYMGVEHKTITPKGRPSVRIESKKSYNSGLIVLDVAHMPFGCGTWPAFWTVGPNWPKNGEIDILEGVNEYDTNGMTLHTGPGCRIAEGAGAQFSGEMTTGNCDVAASDQAKNVGCSIKHPSKQSYGAGLNANGGGVYATQWNDEAISIFFFPRGDIPADVLGDNPNPSTWGVPSAKFSNQGCDIEKHFVDQRIVFDTTFCGQWAGAIWEEGSCAQKAQTCEEYVRDNPAAFEEAYWSINALKIYQDNGQAPNVSPPSIPAPSSVIATSLPEPTITDSFPTGTPPPVPSGIPTQAPAPYPTAIQPSPEIVVPAPSSGLAPVPSSNATVPTQPQSGTSPSAPTSPAQPAQPINAGPGGLAEGMENSWQWPVAAGAPQPSDAPAATPAPESASSNPQATPAPAPPSDDAVSPPVVKSTRTVYNTVYITASAAAAAAAAPTPAAPAPVPAVPAAAPSAECSKAPAARRLARNLRNLRQRLTKHNVRA